MDDNNDNADALNRREFTRRSSLLAGAALLGSASAGAYAAGSDTLKVAVVGCGGRGTGAARQALNADTGVEIVALADAFEEELRRASSHQFGGVASHHIADVNRLVGDADASQVAEGLLELLVARRIEE